MLCMVYVQHWKCTMYQNEDSNRRRPLEKIKFNAEIFFIFFSLLLGCSSKNCMLQHHSVCPEKDVRRRSQQTISIYFDILCVSWLRLVVLLSAICCRWGVSFFFYSVGHLVRYIQFMVSSIMNGTWNSSVCQVIEDIVGFANGKEVLSRSLYGYTLFVLIIGRLIKICRNSACWMVMVRLVGR